MNTIEFESAAYTFDEDGAQVEIGVRLQAIGQMGPNGNLAEVIRARISTSDLEAVASKNQGRFD